MAPECLKLPHLKLARKNAYDSLLISRSTFTDLLFHIYANNETKFGSMELL